MPLSQPLCADLATYEFHIWANLQWLCSECGYYVLASEDIRPEEEATAPEGPWAWRQAGEARATGWFLPASGSALCLCPRCARARGLVTPSDGNTPNHGAAANVGWLGRWFRWPSAFRASRRR